MTFKIFCIWMLIYVEVFYSVVFEIIVVIINLFSKTFTSFILFCFLFLFCNIFFVCIFCYTFNFIVSVLFIKIISNGVVIGCKRTFLIQFFKFELTVRIVWYSFNRAIFVSCCYFFTSISSNSCSWICNIFACIRNRSYKTYKLPNSY